MRARHVNHARGARSRGWRDFRSAPGMAVHRPNPVALRAEARLLTMAGAMLLGAGFPITLALVAFALGPGSDSPFVPAAIGAPPIMLGYLACHFASRRLLKAKLIEATLL